MMGRKKKALIEPPVSKTKVSEMKVEIKNEEMLDGILNKQSDKKVTFAKITFNGNRGPYIVAFEDSLTRDYCEMNAMDFKVVHDRDVKTDTLPVWECGAKTSEQINALPKLNLKQHREKSVKDKEAKKMARAAKMVETRKKKAKE
jgi:hypothetical protein